MPFINPTEMIHGSPLSGWSGRFFHSASMTFAHWEIAEGAADLHEHDHPEEEVWNVVEGELILVIDGRERRLGPGDAAVIAPTPDIPPGPSAPVGPSSSTIRCDPSCPACPRGSAKLLGPGFRSEHRGREPFVNLG